MTGLAPLLQFALLAGFVVALALAVLAALLERPIARLLPGQRPQQRARIAWWWLVGPAVGGLGYAAAIVAAPSLLRGSTAFSAACSAHQGSWWHACVWHPIEHGASPWLWAGLAALVLVTSWMLARALRALLDAHRHLAALVRLGAGAADGGQRDVRVLDVDQPLAVACGMGCGHVLLSRRLVDALPPEQLRVVLAHERAHLAHRDVRWRVVARLLSGLHFPGVRARALASMTLASEQRCDRIAADEVGSRLLVAETILAVERLYRGHPSTPAPALAAAFGTDFLRERVEALLSTDSDRNLPAGPVLAATALAFAIASAGWVHHFTEFLIALLAG